MSETVSEDTFGYERETMLQTFSVHVHDRPGALNCHKEFKEGAD